MSERMDNNHPSPSPVASQPEEAPRSLSLKDRVRSLRLTDNQTRRPSARAWLPWALVLVLGAGCAYLGYNAYLAGTAVDPEKQQASASADSQPRPADRPTGRIALGGVGGYIVPVQRVVVSPKVGGEVIELLKIDGRDIREGDVVEKGQWLAKLDRSKYEFEYQRAVAMTDQTWAEYEKLANGNRAEEIKQSEFALREAEHHVGQLLDEVSRLRRARTAASAEETYRLESRLSQAEAKAEQLRQVHILMQKGWREEEISSRWAAYMQAEAQLANAKYDLDNTVVRAPIGGTILIKRAEVGNTVRPEAFSNGLSASLCEMADLAQMEVDVDVSERDLAAVFEGQDCEIRTEAPSDTIYKGTVARLMPEANRSKASVSVRVRIIVPPGDQHLRPELRARVTFLAKDKSPLK